MKIAIIGPRASSLLAFRGDLLKEFVRLGHEAHAVVPDSNASVESALNLHGIAYYQVPFSRTGTNPLSDLAYLYRLYRYFRRERPDLVLTYTAKPVIFGGLAARFARVPLHAALLTGLGYAFTSDSPRRRALKVLMQNLYRIVLGKSKVAIFQNPDDRDLFVQEGIVSRSKTKVVNGSGVDTKHYRLTPIPDGPPVFLLLARLLKSKGVIEFVDAARMVRAEFPEVQFRLLGRLGDGKDAITASEVEAWENEGLVSYSGFAEDVRPHIAACHAFVLPSYREGTPRSSLEAMSMGRPIITTDAPGCRETVVNGWNGYLVQTQDAEALAHAIRNLLLDPGQFVAMGEASREYALQKYDVAKVNEAMVQALKLSQ